jgi:hypothetical protein
VIVAVRAGVEESLARTLKVLEPTAVGVPVSSPEAEAQAFGE